MQSTEKTFYWQKQFLLHFLFVIASIMFSAFIPVIVFADPPATVATCDGIGDAYPILGTKCSREYAKIDHAPNNPQKRLKSYNARIAVVKIFRQATLCNGMFGADSGTQSRFKSRENGHLTSIANLHTAMTNAGDPNVPALFVKSDLNSVKINKKQCK